MISKAVDLVGTTPSVGKYWLIILALKIISGPLLVFDKIVLPAQAPLTQGTWTKCVMCTVTGGLSLKSKFSFVRRNTQPNKA